MIRTPSLLTALAIGLLSLAACGEQTKTNNPAAPTTEPASLVARSASEASSLETTTTTSPTVETVVADGRAIPRTASTAAEAVALFVEVQRAIRTDGLSEEEYGDLGHTEQLLVRMLVRNPDWVEPFRDSLPSDLVPVADLHLTARRELGKLHTGGGPPIDDIPAWEIIEPASRGDLLGFYRSAEAETGIDWEILAAINLIETGMGRIDGLSSAGAQGPMQFLPTTWEEVSNGGDVNDPEDAIHGAARYVVRRGGLDDIRSGLWGYNNSDHYVKAVLAYAELLELDERALRGLHGWQVYVGTSAGTLWLPVGYLSTEPEPALAYREANPWALTLG